jgi:hypothetical protein
MSGWSARAVPLNCGGVLKCHCSVIALHLYCNASRVNGPIKHRHIYGFNQFAGCYTQAFTQAGTRHPQPAGNGLMLVSRGYTSCAVTG